MKKKRYLLLPLLLLFLLLGCTAFCEEQPIAAVNPEYTDTLTTRDLLSLEEAQESRPFARSLTQIPSFSSSSAASEYIKGQLIAREPLISFTLVSSSAISDMQNTISTLVYNSMEYSPTGAPNEGDYLRWHYGGYKGSYDTAKSGSRYQYTVNLAVTYFSTASQEKKLTSVLNTLMASLGLDGKSDYEKTKIIYDYVTSHVTYDYASLNDSTTGKFSAYNALIKGTAVCQGYASLVYRMLRMAGLQTRFISGTGGGERHGWNIVKIGNSYYNLDSTWDSSSGKTTYWYFLKSNADFSNHIRDAKFRTSSFNAAYPMASASYDLSNSHTHQWDTAYTVDQVPSCSAAGSSSIHCTICGQSNPSSTRTVAALSHKYGSWTVTKQATIFQTGIRVRTCRLCNAKQTQTIPKKAARVTLNVSSITLQIKQQTTAVKIKTKTSGDVISKWTSSKPQVAFVNSKTGKIQAKATGTARITLTMKSGATASVLVKVQKSVVKTTKLTLSKKAMSLAVGKKVTLQVTRTPLTANDKLTYSSSKPYVARISSKGVVTALQPGKTILKVRSASGKLVKCKLTVS
ncbi:MAG: Ig-like domain-containing protein [Candidatus Limivivens sp.]|nr:Ig-like domain-containing protein [Candidatus Limivivens sp.]